MLGAGAKPLDAEEQSALAFDRLAAYLAAMKALFAANYRAHEALVRHARARPQLWRILPVFAIIMAVYWYGYDLIWNGLYAFMSYDGYRAIYDDFEAIVLPQSMLILLYGFGLIWAGLVIGVRLVHRRGFETLVGAPRALWHQSKQVGLALIALSIATLVLPPYGAHGALIAGQPFGTWLALLLPALVGVLIQTSAEEAVFRGYLQQQLAARFGAPWVWMVLPSLLFGLAHYAPQTYGANAWLVVIWAGVFGLIAADLTARSGTLGPAITFHFLSNVGVMLVVSPQGEMSGLALYQYPFDSRDEAALRSYLPFDFALMALGWLAARIALRR